MSDLTPIQSGLQLDAADYTQGSRPMVRFIFRLHGCS